MDTKVTKQYPHNDQSFDNRWSYDPKCQANINLFRVFHQSISLSTSLFYISTKQSSSESQASQEAEASEKTDEKSESSGEGEQAMDTGDVDDSIPLRQAPTVLPEMEIKPFTMVYGMEKQ